MASEVDIANLACAYLGDEATISNLSPPEGSAQATHAARFYPIARDTLLEQHDWNFATRRSNATEVVMDTVVTQWRYAYVVPNDCIKIISVLPEGVADDYSSYVSNPTYYGAQEPIYGKYVTQPYALEIDGSGQKVILTNVPNAFIRWISRVTDTTKFSPLFTDTLARYLASYMAGPILKGDAGRAESKAQLQFAMMLLGKAATSDANQMQTDVKQNVAWINARS